MINRIDADLISETDICSETGAQRIHFMKVPFNPTVTYFKNLLSIVLYSSIRVEPHKQTSVKQKEGKP